MLDACIRSHRIVHPECKEEENQKSDGHHVHLRYAFLDQVSDNRHHKGSRDRAWDQQHSGIGCRPAQNLLRIDRNDQCRAIQPEPEDETHHRPDAQIPVLQYLEIDDWVRIDHFAPNECEQSQNRHDAQNDDGAVVEPVVLLAVFKHELQRTDKRRQEHDSPPIDLVRFEFFAIFRAFHKSQCQKDGNDSKRDVDVENIRPREIIHKVTAQGWPQRRPDDYAHAVNRLGHAAFGDRVTFGDDRLCGHQKRAAAQALYEPESDQFPNVARISAQK